LNIRDCIQARLDELTILLEAQSHLHSPEFVTKKLESVTKFWSALSEVEREYCSAIRHVMKNKLDRIPKKVVIGISDDPAISCFIYTYRNTQVAVTINPTGEDHETTFKRPNRHIVSEHDEEESQNNHIDRVSLASQETVRSLHECL
jgi:hypothetical protein